MQNRPARYYAYLLRFWQECKQSSGGTWRLSMEDPHTGQRQGFANLEAFVAYLKAEMAHSDEAPPAASQKGQIVDVRKEVTDG